MISMLAAPEEVMDTRITELVQKVWLSSARMDMLGWSRHWTLRRTSAPILSRSSGRKSSCGFMYRHEFEKRKREPNEYCTTE